MILEITKLGEEILRQKAEPVAEVNDEIRTLANDMLETMIEALKFIVKVLEYQK